MKGSQLNARTTLSAHHRGLSKEPGLKSIFRHLVTSSLSHNTFLNNFFSWIYKKSQRKHSLTAWKSIFAQTKELLEILRKLGKRSVTSKKLSATNEQRHCFPFLSFFFCFVLVYVFIHFNKHIVCNIKRRGVAWDSPNTAFTFHL